MDQNAARAFAARETSSSVSGALFLAFPSHHAWTVPAHGWHADASYVSALSPPAGVRTHALFGYRRLPQGHPYLHDLHTEGDADERAARFMDHVEEHGGIPLQVVENTGAAGDVIVLHPLVLHVATSNNGNAPRFLLSGGVDLPSMWTTGH